MVIKLIVYGKNETQITKLQIIVLACTARKKRGYFLFLLRFKKWADGYFLQSSYVNGRKRFILSKVFHDKL